MVEALFRSPSHFAAHHYGQSGDLSLIAVSSAATSAAINALRNSRIDLASRLWASVDGERLLSTWNRWNATYKSVGKKWNVTPPAAVGPKSEKVSERLAQSVYERDEYRCRYCDIEVFTRAKGSPIIELIARFPELTPSLSITNGRLVGSGKQGTLRNADYAKFLWSMAAPEHVFPSALGGPTTPENLVCACWGCNGFKMHLTLEQLGVDASRIR